jgi:alpha-L-fucosidase
MAEVNKQVQQVLQETDRAIAAGPFAASWDSLETVGIPQWYQDAKFGIFIHWGVYSVPAFGNEWYPRQMYMEGTNEFKHHVETYGPQSRFGYKDFIPQFKAQKFNAAKWAKLFKDAGARFVVPVAEHHDGFQMYGSKLSKWNAARMGPRKDIVRLLAEAVRKEGLVLGVSSHRIEHWWFMNGGMKFESDVKSGKWADLYGPATADNVPPSKEFMEDWLARSCELVDLFQPQIFWFDWWIEQPVMKPFLRKFAAYYYNRGQQWGKGVAINYKNDAYTPKSAVLDLERGQLADIRPLFWQNDTAVAKNSWGYTRNMDYKTPGMLIGDLVDVVSKNGALLLNIGPRPDGMIPQQDQDILLAIGQWLKVNGEAIYETRPWKVFGEGPTQVAEGMFTDTLRKEFTAADYRFTTRGQTELYAIALGWPGNGKFVIRSLSSDLRLLTREIEGVELLGHGPVKWTRKAAGLVVDAPKKRPCDCAFAIKVQLKA